MPGAKIAKSSGGRPLERDEPKRSAIALRTTPRIKARLMASAESEGRSITQEVEDRIVRSYALEDLHNGPHTTSLLYAISAEIAVVERFAGQRWSEDGATFRAMLEAVTTIIKRHRPMTPNAHEVRALAKRIEELKPPEPRPGEPGHAIAQLVRLGTEAATKGPAGPAGQPVADQLTSPGHDEYMSALQQMEAALEPYREEARRGAQIIAEMRALPDYIESLTGAPDGP